MISTVLKDLVEDQSGATAIEYGLIVALIAIAILGSMQGFAGEAIQLWSGVERDVIDAIGN